MKKKNRTIRFLTCCILLFPAITGCGRDTAETLSPEETVSSFYRELLTGNIDEARALCDTAGTVNTYISSFVHSASEELQGADSVLVSMVSAMIRTEIEDVRKRHGGCSVSFSIGTDTQSAESRSRKMAELKESNGKWMITDITGR